MAISAVVAIAGAAAADVGVSLVIIEAISYVGLALTVVGAITGDQKLMKVGGYMSAFGGGAAAANSFGDSAAADAAASEASVAADAAPAATVDVAQGEGVLNADQVAQHAGTGAQVGVEQDALNASQTASAAGAGDITTQALAPQPATAITPITDAAPTTATDAVGNTVSSGDSSLTDGSVANQDIAAQNQPIIADSQPAPTITENPVAPNANETATGLPAQNYQGMNGGTATMDNPSGGYQLTNDPLNGMQSPNQSVANIGKVDPNTGLVSGGDYQPVGKSFVPGEDSALANNPGAHSPGNLSGSNNSMLSDFSKWIENHPTLSKIGGQAISGLSQSYYNSQLVGIKQQQNDLKAQDQYNRSHGAFAPRGIVNGARS